MIRRTRTSSNTFKRHLNLSVSFLHEIRNSNNFPCSEKSIGEKFLFFKEISAGYINSNVPLNENINELVEFRLCLFTCWCLLLFSVCQHFERYDESLISSRLCFSIYCGLTDRVIKIMRPRNLMQLRACLSLF